MKKIWGEATNYEILSATMVGWRKKLVFLIASMYLRVAFDSFAVRFTLIFSEDLFACL